MAEEQTRLNQEIPSERDTARATRAGARATREGAQASGQAVGQSLEDSGRAARAGMEAVGGHIERFSKDAAEQTERISTEFGAEADEMAHDLARFATFPQLATRSLQSAQEIATNMLSRALETNLSVTKELSRHVNPALFFQMQQRVMHRLVRGMLDSSAEMARTSHRLVENTLRPIEEKLSHAGQGPSNGRDRLHGLVGDAMTKDVEIVSPDQSVQDVARLMEEADVGALPVGENDRLVGMITDRDIALRAVGKGKSPGETRVRDVMSRDVKYVYDDEHLDDVVRNMSEQQIRRLPVMNRDKRLVGIISLGDLSTRSSPERAGHAMRGVAQSH
jgi:CBS domain-containing protein